MLIPRTEVPWLAEASKTALVALLFLSIAAWTGLALAEALIRPLGELRDRAEAFAERLGTASVSSTARGELRQLTETVGSMIRKLGEHERSLWAEAQAADRAI